MNAYQNALEFRPNYVRCWVNLGIAHAFKGEYEQAIQLYLNALAMNPNAKHVWGYLQTCFISLRMFCS
jgi:peroxin-5